MKIVILITDFYSKGGIPQYIRNLVEILTKIYGKKNISVLSLYGSENFSLTLFKKIIFLMRSLIFVIKERPDLIISGHSSLSPIAWFCRAIFKINYWVFIYGIEVWGPLRFFEKRALSSANLIFSISKFTREILVKNLKIDLKKIHILSNFVDPNQFKPEPKSKILIDKYKLEGKQILLTVSKLNPLEKYKGHDLIIRVMAELNKEFPNLVYLIVGEGGDKKRIKNLVFNQGLEKEVIFTGEVDNKLLLNFYNLADIFCMPSRGEGFGFVYLEAAACEKPVIAARIGGASEAVSDNKTGFLINPDNLSELRMALRKLLNNKELRDKMGKEGRKMVIEKFSFEAAEKKLRNKIENEK